MTDSLFFEFPPMNKEAWISQVKKDLKGKDFDTVTKSNYWGDLDLEAFYTLEDLSKLPASQFRFHPPSEIQGFPPRIWSNLISVYPGDSNQSVLQSLESGAEGLILHLSGFEDLSELLKGVRPEYITILIKPLGNVQTALSTFLNWTESLNLNPVQIHGAMLWTPSDLLFDQGESFGLAGELFSEILEMTDAYPNFKAFALKSSRYTESGAHPIEALIYTFGELIELIDRSGISPELIFKKCYLEASIGEIHFGEIARLKAFRQGMISLASLYGIAISTEDLILFAQTSHWSKSILDVNTNLIRQTYEAMAGILGGANWLWVKPFQEETAGDLEKRIARNVSSILKEEAYLDKVLDPAAGSFFLDSLTQKILERIKIGLSELESTGGWLQAFETKKLHETVRIYRGRVQTELLNQIQIKVGVNKYQASGKLKKDMDFETFEEKSIELKPTRASYLLESQTFQMP